MSPDLHYILLLFGLFVVPRLLVRLRIPSAVTSLGLGMLAGALGFFHDDSTIGLLSTFGIVALFLSAGLELDLQELKRGAFLLSVHLGLLLLGVFLVAWAFTEWFRLEFRPSLIIALALLSPSTGFILDSLGGWNFTQREAAWVRSMALAAELLALAALFGVTQSTSTQTFVLSTLCLVGLVVAIPPLFRFFAVHIAPYAPRTEFAFLLMTAVVCAFVTRKLGVYYLVGAFLVGVVARRFRERLPDLSSQRILHAVEDFGMVFTPFYFFAAGLKLKPQELGWDALACAAVFLAILLPARVFQVAALQRYFLTETLTAGLRLGVATLPTLVFALVLTGILRESYAVPEALLGGIVIYTLVVTLLPGFLVAKRGGADDTPRDGALGESARSTFEPAEQLVAKT
ncbi:MAG: cation:proton antiporter [Planctomycetes bacterium]|nr:cation:proton antiporter [Planctomycetota bacterium]